jgi:hypothetical protein
VPAPFQNCAGLGGGRPRPGRRGRHEDGRGDQRRLRSPPPATASTSPTRTPSTAARDAVHASIGAGELPTVGAVVNIPGITSDDDLLARGCGLCRAARASRRSRAAVITSTRSPACDAWIWPWKLRARPSCGRTQWLIVGSNRFESGVATWMMWTWPTLTAPTA